MPKNDRRELIDDMLNDVNGGMESSEATEAENITLPGGNDIVTGVMAYLVDADVLDQQTVLTSVLGKGKTISETLGSAQLGTAQVSEYGFV